MTIEEVRQYFTPEQWLWVALGSLLIVLLLYYWAGHRKSTAPARNLKKTLDQLGQEAIEDAMLPDGVDGFIFIDYVVLTQGGILLLFLKNIPGYIFGAMKMDQWTQMLNNKSHHFDNPLYDLGEALRVVRAYFPGVPVDGRVVFSSTAEFPKGVPENVCMLDELSREEIPVISDAGEKAELETAWRKLNNLVEDTRSNHQVDQRISRYNRV